MPQLLPAAAHTAAGDPSASGQQAEVSLREAELEGHTAELALAGHTAGAAEGRTERLAEGCT